MEMNSTIRSQGYEYNFVDEPNDRYICRICLLPSRDPQMTGECCRGNIVCKSCLDYYTQGGRGPSSNICPVCRKTGLVTYPNFQLDREIGSLHVYCINKERGCEWKGEVNYISQHINPENNNGCHFTEVKCTNCCGRTIERRYLTTHVRTECVRRKINCQYCHDVTLEYRLMEISHISKCPKFPMPCPNNCNAGTILRQDMEKHKQECPKEIIECLNKCGSKLERQKLPHHIQDICTRRKVYCQYCHEMGEYRLINGKHTYDCLQFPVPCPNKCGFIPRNDLVKHRKECPLEEIVCEYHTMGCEITFARKDQAKHKKDMIENHLMMAAHKLSKLDDIQQKLIDAKAELMSLNNSVSTTTDTLAKTKHELTDTKLNLRNTKAQAVTLKHLIDDTRGTVNNTKHELENTKLELKNTKDQAVTLQHSLDDIRGTLHKTKQELTDTKLELNSSKDQTAALQHSLDDTRGSLHNTKRELTDTKLELKSTKDQTVTLQHLLDDTRGILHNTKHELTDTKLGLKNTKDQTATLQHSLGDTRGMLCNTKHELADTKLELKNTKDQTVTLQHSLDDTTGALHNTKCELADTRLELKITKQKVAELEHSLNDTKCQLSATSTQFTNLMVLLHTQMKSIMGINVSEVISDVKPSVKLNAMATVFKLGDQITPVTLKIPEFKKKQKDNEVWFSEPFFTHIQGYKMRLCVVAAGSNNGRGTHVSVYLYLMKGPHDDILKWPLRTTFEVKLMNQIGTDHHSKTIIFEAANNSHTVGKGDPQFISNRDLLVTTTTRQFLKDNCVFFTVTKL